MALTRQGPICYDVYERTKAIQGDNGPIITQSHIIRRGGGKRFREQAFWSAHPGVIALLDETYTWAR